MFKTLASKLNGDKSSKENTPSSSTFSNNNSSNGKSGQGKIDLHTGSSAPLSGGNGSHSSAISRPTNPFAKGFSGLHNEHNSYRPLPANQQTRTSPTNNLPRTSATNAPTGGPHQHKSSGNRKEQQTSPIRVKNPVPAASTESADGDLSFGADDFLIGSDELALADLMDDLDEHQDRDESLSLSWTPTPPKNSGAGQQGTAKNLLKPDLGSTVAHGWPKVSSVPSSQAPTEAPHQATRTFVHSIPPEANIIASEPSDRGIIMVPNSQEDTSTRPNERDTIDHRSAQRAQDMKEQDRKGLLRTQSSPSTGFASRTPPNRNRRRLPGPAGNLPRLSAEEKEQLFRSRGVPFGKDSRLPGTNSTSPNSSIKKKMKAVAQGPVDSMFANGAWEEMRKAYGLPDYKPSTMSQCKGTSPMIELCLSDIESRQDLHRGKISGLVVMIKEVSLSEIDAAVTLLDPSGEMRGTIHRTVLDQYKNNEIRVGTVLALKNVQSQDELREIQFQSLRQTLGASSTTSSSNQKSEMSHDLLSTPMISLGGATPRINAGTPSMPNSSKQLLSSFAASASLRKRSSPTRSTSQTSAASDSGARSRSGANSASGSHAFLQSAAIPEIEAARSSSAKSPTSPERPMDALSSYDWPDDFAEVDFEVSLDEGHPSFPERGQNDAPRSTNANPPTVQAPIPRRQQDGMMAGDDDDDLENLLDGLDENDLFDLDS
ncbi:hypothetical protein EC968_010660 [Mortierella alpina]|nr:hypothetical protein EC968_010660 [Mortierella alpina]